MSFFLMEQRSFILVSCKFIQRILQYIIQVHFECVDIYTMEIHGLREDIKKIQNF
uniref:Uncharacterized protein n=1 Tax=Octopus bimaculoides TaxID=37653 RepID=A0A0L8HA52_OCTBM